MSGNTTGNTAGVFGGQGFGAQGYGPQFAGQGQQQLSPQVLAEVVGRVTQAAVPVILSALQNNSQLGQNAGQQGLGNSQFNPFNAAQAYNPQLGQNSGLQGQFAGFGQQAFGQQAFGQQGLGQQGLGNAWFNPFNAGQQQGSLLQNGSGDISRIQGGQQVQHLANAITQHVAQQLSQIIAAQIYNLASSQQLRQGLSGDLGAWLGGAAQAIGVGAAQQIAQQLPIVIGSLLSNLQNQSQQNQQVGAQGINPGLFSPQAAQSNYAVH